MQTETCPASHQILPISLLSSSSPSSCAREDEEFTSFCLTCFEASLQPCASSSPLPAEDVQKGLVAILTGLTQQCPGTADVTDASQTSALRRWVRERLDPSVDASPSTPDRRGCTPCHGSVGRVLAGILIAVYKYFVHHLDAAVHLRSSSGGGQTAFVELAVFVFAGWELVLYPDGAHAQPPQYASQQLKREATDLQSRTQILPPVSQSSPESHYDFTPLVLGGMDSALSYFPHSLHRTGYQHPAQSAPRLSHMLLPNEEDEAYLSPVHETAVLEEVNQIVGCLVEVLIQACLSTGAASRMCHTDQLHRSCFTAASLLSNVVSQAPLLRRTLRTSGHIIAVVRVALPLYAEMCVPTLAAPPRKRMKAHASRHEPEPSDAPQLLLQLIYAVLLEARSHPARQALLALELTSAAQTNINQANGQSLLSSVLHLLNMALPRLTPLVLAILQESLTWSVTRLHLLRLPLTDAATRQPPSWRPAQTQEELGRRAFVAASDVAPLPALVDVAVALGPLLLHQSGDVIRLACDALKLLLNPSITADAAVLTTETWAAASSVSRSASIAVAHQVEGYAVQAVEASTTSKPALCAPLVELAELVASILEEAEGGNERSETPVGSPSHSPLNSASADAGKVNFNDVLGCLSEHWDVVFHVARVDLTLFERLICGAFFRRALRSHAAPSSRHGAASEQHGNVDWNSVVLHVIHTVLDAPPPSSVSKCPTSPLTLFTYLCLLEALATGMGSAMPGLWPEGLARLMKGLTEHVDKHVEMRAQGEEGLMPLHRLLEPRTHQLLVYVTAAYLPCAGAALQHVALMLLTDVVHSRGLASARCPERILRNTPRPSRVAANAEGEDEEERECHCLLSIATQLLRFHDERAASSSWPSDSGEKMHRVCRCVKGGAQAEEANFALLHELCAPPRERGLDPTHNLFNVLLSLHAESPALMEARQTLIRAIKGETSLSPYFVPGILSEDTDGHGPDPFALVGVCSLAELLEMKSRASDTAMLLLGITNWVRAPCVAESRVDSMAANALERLVEELAPAAQRMSGTTANNTTVMAEELGELNAPSSDMRLKDERVSSALQRLFALVIVSLRWYGVLSFSSLELQCTGPSLRIPSTPTTLEQLGGGVGDPFAAVEGGEAALLQPLLLYVEESHTLRKEVCHFLFYAASRHHVDVHRLLITLSQQCAGDHLLASRDGSVSPQTRMLFPGLAAVIVLSAILYSSELSTGRAEDEWDAEGDADDDIPISATTSLQSFLASVTALHWLTEVFRVRCRQGFVAATTASAQTSDVNRGTLRYSGYELLASFPAQLLLMALFRSARNAALGGGAGATATSQNASQHGSQYLNVRRAAAASPQDELEEVKTSVSVKCLGYVLAEALYHMRLRRSQQKRICEQKLTVRECALETAASSMFFKHLLSLHLVPLISAFLRVAAPPLRVCAEDECSLTLLRLTCVSLWFLGSVECSEFDAVLTQYALRYIRLCLSLTEAEVESSYTEADCDDGEEGSGERQESASKRCILGLPRLTLLVLQLFYLLLMRSNRSAVATADINAVLLFATMARRAAAERSACTRDGNAEVHVMAAIVLLYMHQLVHGVHTAVGQPGNGGAGTRWFECIHLAAFQEQPSNFITSAAYRKRVWVLLAGVECVLRVNRHAETSNAPRLTAPLLGTSTSSSSSSTRWVHGGETDAKWGVVSVLLDWCYNILLPPSSATLFASNGIEAMGEDAADVKIVTARMFFLLLHRCPSMIISTNQLDAFLVAYCSNTPAMADDHTLQHLVVEGWVLAALLGVLCCFPHWEGFRESLESRVMRFLARPEVLQQLKRPHTGPAAPAARSLGSDVGTQDREVDDCDSNDAVKDASLQLLLMTLTDVIRTYERKARSSDSSFSSSSGSRLLPIGCSLYPGSGEDDVNHTRWWTPYAIPNTLCDSDDTLPLLFVFHHLLY